MTETMQYTVGRTPIRHNGKRYAPGESIVLDTLAANRLHAYVSTPRSLPTEADQEGLREAQLAVAEALTPSGGNVADNVSDSPDTPPSDSLPAEDPSAGAGRSRKKKD